MTGPAKPPPFPPRYPMTTGRGPSALELARFFHDAYEDVAVRRGYRVQNAPLTSWEDMPKKNRDLLVATCERVLKWLRTGSRHG